jgi:hypothetical protein
MKFTRQALLRDSLCSIILIRFEDNFGAIFAAIEPKKKTIVKNEIKKKERREETDQ